MFKIKAGMLKAFGTYCREFARCTKHNVLHLRAFRVSYRDDLWHVRDGKLEMTFPYYPYLAFHDIEGYLFDGRWRPEPGMVVLDVGGCYGEFALYASKRVGPQGRVLMLEPDPANVAIARKNFELNGNPANIQIVPAGLWSKRGTVRFSTGHEAQSAVVAEGAEPGGSVVEIETHTFASLIEQFGLGRLDFVKMDIEGAELEAISSARELPAQFKPRYSIASYHVVDGKQTALTLEKMFADMDYYCRSGNPRHLTTWASPEPLS